jgi:hypothetical protein
VQQFFERDVQKYFEREVQQFFERDVQKFFEREVQEFFERDVQKFFERDVQEFYERDVQQFFECEVQQFFERTVQKFFECTVQEFFERTVQEFYERDVQPYIKPVFEKPDPYEIIITKTVEGKLFGEWVSNYGGNMYELLDDIQFELYKVSENGGSYYGDPIGWGFLEPDGTIGFRAGNTRGTEPLRLSQTDSGWYAVAEKLGSVASQVFETTGAKYFCVAADGTITGGLAPVGPFTVRMGYIRPSYMILYPGGIGGVLDVYTAVGADGSIYDSLCADVKSLDVNLSREGYIASASDMKKAELVSALGYINDVYGLEAEASRQWREEYFGRFLAQVSVWTIIEGYEPGEIVIETDIFGAERVKSGVSEVLTAVSNGYVSASGLDIVTIDGGRKASGHSYQPQILIFFNNNRFDNKLKYSSK